MECFVVFLFFVISALVVEYFSSKYESDYRSGRFDLHPHGRLIVYGVDQKNGQFARIRKVFNPCREVKSKKLIKIIYEYKTESDWLEAAKAIADQHPGSKIRYRHEWGASLGEEFVRDTIVYSNGKWH